jgi:ankyrin repeat protein
MKMHIKFKSLLTGMLISIGFNAIGMDAPDAIPEDELELQASFAIAPDSQVDELIEQLGYAAEQGEIEYVQDLISIGVNVNKKATGYHPGCTALMNAATMNNHEVVNILLAAGAEPNIVGDFGYTALFAAMRLPKMVKRLIQAKADVNQIANYSSDESFSPLMRAIRTSFQDPEIVNMLIAAGANLYYINGMNNTALVWAGRDGNVPVARTLLTAITELPQVEKNSIRNWLFVTKKMQAMHGIFIPKDIRILIAKTIQYSCAQDIRERVIRAGGPLAIQTALQYAEDSYIHPDDLRDFIELIKQYMNLDFLTERVHKQSWPNRVDQNQEKMEDSE